MYWFLVTVHLLAAAVWVGGIVFLFAVAVPVTRTLDPSVGPEVTVQLGRRFRNLGWAMLIILVLTGPGLLATRSIDWPALFAGGILTTSFGRALTVKVIAVGSLLIGGLLHDFEVGPRAARLTRAARTDPATFGVAARRERRRAIWLARGNLLASLVVVAAAVALVRGLL